ncbi:undecaprenyl/decaprenyl-phosphate alpha-N-acetylglucosaminyl 1-phosphate transferase [Candidatus Uhrbacteria bacterium]|jgi:UDP-GlcNAc:undecaprenyl-phosphate/decaprenyl-phosphate GlcNAc-1-phosphate transferase|nr:undecaprenyl/decaprenyl-phosphate alpha-N-acetylglucosaminyl 1-phosphate transferase [Candidatus Uhrbacteria bacterium]
MAIWWIYPIIASFLLSLLLSDVGRSFGRRLGFLDRPAKPRKQHKGGISTLGGVAVFIAFSIVVLAVLLMTDHFTLGEISHNHFIGFLIGGFVLIVGGLVDDRYDLAPKYSILFPVAAALLAAGFGIGVSKITNPLGGFFEISELLSFIVTFLWLLGVMYTTKLLDGLDGLAGGVSAIGMLIVASLALSVAFYQPDVALLALIGCAALVGFLVWNTHPASLFLGEGGSTLVGYMLAVMAVIAGSKIATTLLVVAIPLFDIIFVVWDRKMAGHSVTKGDRRHLHQRLRDSGWSIQKVVWFYYIVALAFGLTTLIFESWQKLVALVVLFAITFIVIRAVSIKKV